MPKALDISGFTFGYLKVIKKTDNRKSGQVMWLCECDCGTMKEVRARSLADGNTTSCGCRIGKNLLKHGLYKHKLMNVWTSIRQKCNNPKSYSYDRYGLKGVTVCDEWEDFETFYKWSMENGYKEGLVIDRIDTYGDYESLNCRWITQSDNCKNKMIQSNNTSGYIGVSKLPDGRFRVYYTLNGKRKQIGISETAVEGSQMRARYLAKHKIRLRNGI